MTRKTSANGFAPLLVIGVLLVVAALGLGGFFVWQHSRKSDHKAATATTSTNQSAQNKNSGSQSKTTTDPSEGGKYLVIKEWGVRFALPQDLQGDVEYGIRKNVDLTEDDSKPAIYGDVAFFASKRLDAIQASPNDCGLHSGGHDDLNDRYDPTSYDGGPGVSLSRSATADGGMQIGDYWYGASHGSAAACYERSDGTQEIAFISETMKALASVTAIPE